MQLQRCQTGDLGARSAIQAGGDKLLLPAQLAGECGHDLGQRALPPTPFHLPANGVLGDAHFSQLLRVQNAVLPQPELRQLVHGAVVTIRGVVGQPLWKGELIEVAFPVL